MSRDLLQSEKSPGDQQFGFVEWFRPGDYERTEQIISELERSSAAYLRTHLSWAEYLAPGGEEWFDWLIPKLCPHLDLLLCVHYTPPSMSRTGRTSGAPHVLKSYADFVDHVLTRYGKHFRHLELWNEPNNLLDWDWREDPDFQLFSEMVGGAAYWAKQRGYKPVLGGPSPLDPYWLNLMGERGVLNVVDAVGLHGFPGTWDSEQGSWGGWDMHLGEMRRIIDNYNPEAEIWITETGYSTWRNDEMEQVRKFAKTLDLPADRLYWYSWRDIPPDIAVQEGLWFDPRHYHLGAVRHEGQPKLLARLLSEGGVGRIREIAQLAAPKVASANAPIVITGGCGFIGSNLAESFLLEGEDVIVVDNLARSGVDDNLSWLKAKHGDRVHPVFADVRDRQTVEDALKDARAVFHLAAQTAVTTSLDDPVDDFETNARGSLNILEAVRRTGKRMPVILASTNKVYGQLEKVELFEADGRYLPVDEAIRDLGIAEEYPLDFCTPYGCSKGVADQYFLDYAKSFQIPTAVLRMSCIYGPRQHGTEDQGWVAHFLLRALAGLPVSLYGDGKQVRDILYVDDAVRAYRRVHDEIGTVSGQAYNLGGGPENAVSLLTVLDEIEAITGRPVNVTFNDWRAGDQRYFVADTGKLRRHTNWAASVHWRMGLRSLTRWLADHRFEEGGLAVERQRAFA
ncbi:NAD-dependent epimerase/dehydratase family protein [Roseibium salinum]|uniref:SDR family NAD(P)-dependent oxidoreductase n=1 Tax=Roseibium salinum TaxID=1604349 RepID=A0ABT3QX87_9HYPH|nr:NAD-dependent epimerase/dehydratase family protein [Roseibium sp. DSM 29163]MCX2721451.1 SDR family NAD(P)-dependent oxidoreductase [Roseibium sp. DSM 29163]MDN3721925.1 SDR family NAD(P)-dependent oxidoreductase [Roseibium salinum]